MMAILLLDTETNGLPKNRHAPISEPGNYPAILQISWARFTIDGNKLIPGQTRDIGVRLDPSIPFDAGAAKIHGITETEARQGVAAATALLELAEVMRSVDVVVAHNMSFDKPVIRAAAYAEWSRSGDSAVALRNIWPDTVTDFCTMRAYRDLVRLPTMFDMAQYKLPRLNELFNYLHGHNFDISGASLHSSKNDTECLTQCIRTLLDKGLLMLSIETESGAKRTLITPAFPGFAVSV
jgi:DNA polymerase-3 subunit alpha